MAGLPADIAAEHQARGEVIALGVRGIAVIIGGIAAAAALSYVFLLGLIGWSALRTSHPASALATVRKANVLDVGATVVKKLGLGHVRRTVFVCALVVIGAAFLSWRFFAIAIATVTLICAGAGYLHERRHKQTRPSLALIVITLLAVGAAGTAWQLDPPVDVQAAIVVPIDGAKGVDVHYFDAVKGAALPYLGETNTHVYVAEVRRASLREAKLRKSKWTSTGSILEVPRDGVRLIFPPTKGTLYRHWDSPGIAFSHAFSHALHSLRP